MTAGHESGLTRTRSALARRHPDRDLVALSGTVTRSGNHEGVVRSEG